MMDNKINTVVLNFSLRIMKQLLSGCRCIWQIITTMSNIKPVKGSQNYVWFMDQVLGKGAMGAVVVARHRKRGTKRAAKVYNPESRMSDYIHRELAILRKITEHINIVKFIAIEEETYSKSSVVILELCDGGSVQQLLDQATNYHGLCQDQFLLVFKHIGRALNHLHTHRIVHRDVKPGNILLQITPDGSFLFKLTDFGSAKQLDGADDNLRSIHGTEEYIHPQLHTSAFIRRVPTSLSGFAVDLWSFGVTMYQCASGKLPFRPKDGIRQDKHMMNELMIKRDPAVISRYQTPDGQIVEEKDLPKTSKIHRGTKKYVVAILVQLFNTKNPTPIQQLQNDIKDFYERAAVCVYSFDFNSFLSVHLKEDNCITHLKEEISKVTDIPAQNQTLLTSAGLLKDSLSPSSKIGDFPRTSIEQPIIVVSKKAEETITSYIPFIPAAPDIIDTLPPLIADAKWATEMCGNMYLCQHITKTLIQLQDNCLTTRVVLNDHLSNLFKLIDNTIWRLDTSKKFIASLTDNLARFVNTNSNSNSKRTPVEEKVKNLGTKLADIEDKHASLFRMYETVKGNIQMYSFMTKKGAKPSCMIHDRCKEKCDMIVKEAVPMYESILADKGQDKINHNEAEIHRYNKSELKRLYRRLKEYLLHCCVQNTKLMFTESQGLVRDAMMTWTLTIRLEKLVLELDDLLQQCQSDVLEITSMHHTSNNKSPKLSSHPAQMMERQPAGNNIGQDEEKSANKDHRQELADLSEEVGFMSIAGANPGGHKNGTLTLPSINHRPKREKHERVSKHAGEIVTVPRSNESDRYPLLPNGLESNSKLGLDGSLDDISQPRMPPEQKQSRLPLSPKATASDDRSPWQMATNKSTLDDFEYSTQSVRPSDSLFASASAAGAMALPGLLPTGQILTNASAFRNDFLDGNEIVLNTGSDSSMQDYSSLVPSGHIDFGQIRFDS